MSKLTKSAERILSEDVLKHLYHCQEQGHRPMVQSVAGALQVSLDKVTDLLDKMVRHGLLQMQGDQFILTPGGRAYAVQIIRAHRLWERYLADETGFAPETWHAQAEQYEHTLSPAQIETLSAQLNYPTHDPHGDPIPTANGQVVPPPGQPLSALRVGDSARIVHLEDEPGVVYAQLVAEGLYPGLILTLTEVSKQRIRFLADGREQVLAPVIAANVTVVCLPKEKSAAAEPDETLADLNIDETGRVLTISPLCRGPERRRLMDLGILSGTLIKAEMISPSGDPTAYRIRGALIGLRQEQAAMINITRDVDALEGVTQARENENSNP